MIHTYPLESRVLAVDRALDLLEILRRSSRGLTLSEISRRLATPVSTTHDLISTLVARGYLQRNVGSHQYSVGVRALDFSIKDNFELQLRQGCSSYIQPLAEEVALPVTVGTRTGAEGMFVARAIPPGDSVNQACIGRHFPLHCTAQGKVLTAWLSDEELERLFADYIFFQFTPRTIGCFDHLKTHLAEVRKRGFAVNEEEEAIGARSIGAPVFNHIGTVAASVSMGDISQTPLERILRFADNLLGTTKEISRQISAGLGSHEIESRRSLDGWRGPGSLRSVT